MPKSSGTSRQRCRTCGTTFTGKSWHRYCWSCWLDQRYGEATANAYQRGFSAGWAAAAGDHARRCPAQRAPVVDRELLRRAALLAHPDRHPPERAGEANAVTARLLSLVQELPA